MKIRKNLTLNDKVLEMADELMDQDGFEDLSPFLESLIREKHQARYPSLRETPPAWKTNPQPSPTLAKAAQELHDEWQDGIQQKAPTKKKTPQRKR